MARKFDSEISIDNTGKWFFRGNEITQIDVLKHFKKNILEDEIGIYIENKYMELVEHGYLEAKFPVLQITNYLEQDNKILLGIEEKSFFEISEFDFYIDENEFITAKLKNSKLLIYSFRKEVLQFLSEIFEENENGFLIHYNSEKIKIEKTKNQYSISVPNFKP